MDRQHARRHRGRGATTDAAARWAGEGAGRTLRATAAGARAGGSSAQREGHSALEEDGTDVVMSNEAPKAKEASASHVVAGEARDVPLKYKRTELGVIPWDWDIRTISAVAEIRTGPFGSALHEHDYVDEGTPIITVEHLTERGILHDNL